MAADLESAERATTATGLIKGRVVAYSPASNGIKRIKLALGMKPPEDAIPASMNRVEDRAARRLAAIIESSDDAIVSKDLNGIITSWNQAAERMFGYTAAEVVGQSITIIIPKDRLHEEREVLSRIRAGKKVDHFETLRRHKSGKLVPISLTVSPIRESDGTVTGASKIARDISYRLDAEAERDRLLAEVQRHAAITAKLNDVGAAVASSLEREKVLQIVTDAATELTGAAFGAFFYTETDADSGNSYPLYTLSGATRDDFSGLPHPRVTELFAPTFRGERTVRVADVRQDPRFGKNPPYNGLPDGHLAVTSYLAVPVKARSGEVLGGLFFAHSQPGVFTADHERLAEGVAAWASVALENARLYKAVHEAGRLKDEFLATLSHELRTPLNAILGYSRMLRNGLVEMPKRDRAIEVIERNATSLAQIVEDVLDVSRIIAGKIRLNIQPVDPREVIRNSIASVGPAADARGVRIETALLQDVGLIAADPDRLQQVLWNLLSNAVKFTGRGGRVQVELRRDNSDIEVVVSDTGIGISPDFIPFLFDRFRQADGRTTREQGGLGLGLAIARHFVEMHGGTISASSPGQGEGARFHIKLPIMAVLPDATSSNREPRLASGAEPAIASLAGVHVLAVDDDADALKLLRDVLETAGAQVTTVASANEALAVLSVERPDVLVADLGMPRMDGFELIERVRAGENGMFRNVPAAALTGYARSEDEAKALRSGFQMHISKPIDPGALTAAVAALARRRQNMS